MPSDADHLLDVTGLFCPEPVMLLHSRIRDIGAGETLRIEATDPATRRDIPRFCTFLGHELLQEEERGGLYIYLLRKRAGDTP